MWQQRRRLRGQRRLGRQRRQRRLEQRWNRCEQRRGGRRRRGGRGRQRGLRRRPRRDRGRRAPHRWRSDVPLRWRPALLPGARRGLRRGEDRGALGRDPGSDGLGRHELVTTYAAWDYHQKGPGQWDFTGARDVGKFVDLACARGLKVVFKPGPLITGEWPRGFGTFGAVPAWWKQAHPEALAKKSNGQLFNYSPTGAADQTQPSYLHPTYLAAVKEWYAQVLAPVKKHLGGCLVAIQVDNETNLYWGNRYGDVDYSSVALTHYRDFLQKKYSTIGALNTRYGKSYSTFADVAPPSSAPSFTTPRKDNPWYADWYWAGQALSRDYLADWPRRAPAWSCSRRRPDAARHYCAANTNGTLTVVDPLELENCQPFTRAAMQLARPG
ncbi:MAG: beta-galactosidase [Myxococcales bacterium]|nr:beta-galactosidase [Myxococcales bacterium]